jgi:Flp pilus assembly protein TadD
VSLISDALKMAQRERNDRGQSANEPQPLIDGFFPYVSSAPTKKVSRRGLFIAISGATLLVLGVVGFLLWPTLTGSRNPQPKSPIVLPPRVAGVTKPLTTDTATRRVVDSQVVPTDAPVGRPAVVQDVPQAPRRATAPENPVTIRAAEPAPPRRDSAVARAIETVERTPTRAQPAVPRVDYEAQAAAAFNAGDLVTAREQFQLATRFAPTARAWTNYGVTLQRLGDLGGAAAAYQSAIGVDANYLEAWLYQGRLAVQMGDVAKAIPLFQRARAINPRHAEVNVELARLESEVKNWSETRRFAAEAVRSDPTNARAQWYLAVSSDQLKDPDTAIRAYTAYLQTVGAAEREQSQFVGWARQRLAELRGKS